MSERSDWLSDWAPSDRHAAVVSVGLPSHTDAVSLLSEAEPNCPPRQRECVFSLSGWLCVGVVSSNHQSTHLLSPAQQPAVQLAWLSIWLLCHHCLSYTSGSTRVFAPFDFIPCANLYSLCASGSSALQSASQPFPPCHLLCLSPALPFISVVCSQYSLVISLHQLQSVFPVDYSALSFTCVLTMVRQFSSYA